MIFTGSYSTITKEDMDRFFAHMDKLEAKLRAEIAEMEAQKAKRVPRKKASPKKKRSTAIK